MRYHVLHYRLKKLKRAFLIWLTLISLLINLWIDNFRFKIFQIKNNDKNRVQIKRARCFTNQLIKLGSAFIKIGQLLSARPDLIPNTWIQELSKLQDQVPNFSFTQVEETIRNELGTMFNEIDQIICDPVGSASLAQVHRATLKDGKKVVFKVQRPNLKELFIIDLGIIQQISGLLQKNKNWSRGRNWIEIAKECRKVLMKELDFNCEAQYAARFRQQFIDDENVEVPEVIWDMSSEKVLCLSYLEGTKISDLEKLQSQEINLPKIAEIGAISYLKQLVNYGFFHADPHPGNLAVSNEGKLIFYDFGMMGNISNNLQTRLGKRWPIGIALKGLLDKILTDPRWDLKFIGMQVIIEGLALAAFQAAKEGTSDPVYKQMLEYIIRDEARHVTFGINYLTDFVTTLSKEEQMDRAKFALEACTVSRNRLKAYEVWNKYSLNIEETEQYQKEHIFQTQFQDTLFSRIMPNLKKIGLLQEELIPFFDKLGVTRIAFLFSFKNLDNLIIFFLFILISG